MKYRFRLSEHKLPLSPDQLSHRHRRRYRLRGRNTLGHPTGLPDSIEQISLFEFAELPEGNTPKRRKVRRARRYTVATLLRRFSAKAGAFFVACGGGLSRFFGAIGRLVLRLFRPKAEKSIHTLPIFCGALCAALLVFALSAATVFLGLFGRYGRSYTQLTVPDFVGKEPTAVIAAEKESPFNLIIQYEYNPHVGAGLVISQQPHAGVTRRIYEADGYCTVTLTVSRGEEVYKVENLLGLSRRDAELALHNQGIRSAVIEEFSATVPRGNVISFSPGEGAILSADEIVTLRISKGPMITLVSVPDLIGLSESEAAAKLTAAGLSVGSVTYSSSSRPIGTVIAQEVAAHEQLTEKTAVSYTVSAGNRGNSHAVPDLYGLSLEEARMKLRELGLVVGTVYSVSCAAPRGTVIAQTPLPLTPITSSTVSVDLYVSG